MVPAQPGWVEKYMAKDSIEKDSATKKAQKDVMQRDEKNGNDFSHDDVLQEEKNDIEVEVIPAIVGGDPGQAEPMVNVLEVETGEGVEGAEKSGESGSERGGEEGQPSERREMVKSASLVALGNLSSSIMGMVRQSFLAATGAGISAPFLAAILPAQRFNDFIINGSAQSALVPVFNDYAVPEKREELRDLIFTIVNLVLLVMTISSVIYFFIAPWLVTTVLATGLTAAEQALALEYTRIIFFSLMALGPFSVLEASLYAQKEFGWTSVASTSYHVGIIIGALVTTILGNRYFGAYGLPSGVILGALGEIGLLVPAMRKRHMRYKLVLDLRHPALRPMMKLYIPAAFSFFFTAALALLDQHLATQTPCMAFMAQYKKCGDVNLSAMAFATLLIQFPGGLVASALSFAVLPTLTAYMRNNDLERFKSMLLLGFRLGLLLMIPAAAGLIVLQLPIVQVLFMHKNFTYDQSVLTGIALQNYAYQLPFLAIDQLLLAAFYARKNALLPVIV